MIFLVSNQYNLYDSNSFVKITLEEAIDKLRPLKYISTDTETQG